jgi:hypothetical protein
MKRRGFTLPGYKYREWEQSKTVCVYAAEEVALEDTEKTIAILNELISELDLPLVTNAAVFSNPDSALVDKLLSSNTQKRSIDCTNLLKDLRCYWDDRLLRHGVIILVNPATYDFKNEPSDPEPAIYGWTSNEGLALLRRFDIENAVRHEFGHMIGLNSHHPSCAMDWSCSIHEFCENCRKDIIEIWGL